MTVEWTEPARDDLHGVFNFVALENPDAAERLVERLLTLAKSLSQFQHLGREGRKAGTRELIVTGTPFFLTYRVIRDKVQILNVIHGARRWPG